jgi:hypothetical protein
MTRIAFWTKWLSERGSTYTLFDAAYPKRTHVAKTTHLLMHLGELENLLEFFADSSWDKICISKDRMIMVVTCARPQPLPQRFQSQVNLEWMRVDYSENQLQLTFARVRGLAEEFLWFMGTEYRDTELLQEFVYSKQGFTVASTQAQIEIVRADISKYLGGSIDTLEFLLNKNQT